jgi:hypothetical protein
LVSNPTICLSLLVNAPPLCCSLKNLTMELNSHLTEDGALLVGSDIKVSGDGVREANGSDAGGARAGAERDSPGAGADSKGIDAKDGADGGDGASAPSTGIAGECGVLLVVLSGTCCTHSL